MKGLYKMIENNARIQIKSKLGAPDDDDIYNLYTTGNYTEKNGNYYIRYSETTGLDEQSNTTIKVTNERLVIMRSGGPSTEAHLIVEKNKRSEGHYRTPMGNILVGVNNGSLDNNLTKDGGTLCFSYDLDMNGQFIGKNEMSINIVTQA